MEGFGAYSPHASSSYLSDLKRYDVFISFRGEDTRDNFTSHLHAALCRNQIETYIDNRLERGDEVWPALVHAIKDSIVFLIIFSENYASSTWCLNELVEIMECKQSGQQHIIPVFYRVDPSHVRKQSGSYRTALAKHERGFERYDDMSHKWKDALFQAANLSGFDSRAYRTESDLIESIIQTVLRKLDHECTNELRGNFIQDQNYACIEYLLRTQSVEVQTIGIWGMGGIGKTTIAAAIFQEYSPRYEGSCFLANVREESSRHGLNYIFNKLLCELLQEDIHISTPKIVSSTIMRRLRRKKVFIVLDDVNTSELLENLLGVKNDYLGAGSKVIVTTRDKHVLTSRAVNQIHEVKEMNYQNSLKLFSLNAFNKIHPKNGYWELSKRAVAYAKGIPLALKVLGLFLHSKSEIEWDSALMKLKKIPNADIQKVLRLSFDELDDTEKIIFLDIACFSKGQKRGKVTMMLNDCGFFADIGIRNLLDKALITIPMNNSIQMHDLIQEMGQKIVCDESKSPGGYSRLWKFNKICDILKENKGIDAIESIFLDITQTTDLQISSHAFGKVPNQRFLAFSGSIGFGGKRINNTLCLPTYLELPNNLRYIQWDECPLKSLSSICWPNKLVELSIQYNNAEKLWDGVQNLPSLEIIDLRGSKRMIKCPNLPSAPNLKVIYLTDCDNLPHVHPSIFSLQKLETLPVYQCEALESLCGNSSSPSLQTLVAYACPNLQEFLVPMSCDHSGIHLHSRSTALKQMQSSILHPGNLKNFSFPINESLMDLPANFVHQIMLSDPSEHECHTVVTLRTVLSSPVFQYVRRLIFDSCYSLTELPDNIFLLPSLVYLSLDHCTNLISLPESIKRLPRLEVLNVCQCEKLQLIPVLPPSFHCLRAWDCKSLKTVLSSRSEPPRNPEGTFLFLNCINLDEDSYNTILKDALVRERLGAKAPLTTKLKNREEACVDAADDDCYINVGEICYFLPVRGSEFRDLFHEYSTQALISIGLPPNSNLSGFLFFLVLSQTQLCDIEAQLHSVNDLISFGCECYLETSWGERVHTTSSSSIKWHWDQLPHKINIISDHVLLWYDAQCCKQIMETIKGRKTIDDKRSTYSAKLTFKFFAGIQNKAEAVIKECGIRWIYPNVEEGSGGRKSKRSREIYELEAVAVQNGEEGSESNEQEEPIPPTKKFKQSFLGTPLVLEAEVEDMRQKLEELLHVDLMEICNEETKLGYSG